METPRRRALGIGLNELFNSEVLDFNELDINGPKINVATYKAEITKLVIKYKITLVL